MNCLCQKLSGIGLGLAVVGDSALTLTLIFAFRKSRQEGGQRRTSTIRMEAFGNGIDKTDMATTEQYDVQTSQRQAESVVERVQLYIVNTGRYSGVRPDIAHLFTLARAAHWVCDSRCERSGCSSQGWIACLTWRPSSR